MAGGSRQKPVALKLLTGAPRYRDLRPELTEPEEPLYEPPDHLNDAQRKIWWRIIHDAPERMLRSLDLGALAAYAVAENRCDIADAMLAKEGAVIMSGTRKVTTTRSNGDVVVTEHSSRLIRSPWAAEQRDAFNEKVKLISELGLSPTSRARLAIKVPSGGSKQANRFSRNSATAQKA